LTKKDVFSMNVKKNRNTSNDIMTGSSSSFSILFVMIIFEEVV